MLSMMRFISRRRLGVFSLQDFAQIYLMGWAMSDMSIAWIVVLGLPLGILAAEFSLRVERYVRHEDGNTTP